MGGCCSDRMIPGIVEEDNSKELDVYFEEVVANLKRIKEKLDKHTNFLNGAEKKQKNVQEKTINDMYANLTKDNKLVSFTHQQFYVKECNTFVKLKSVLEDVFFFRNSNRDYNNYQSSLAEQKSNKFDNSFQKNRNDFLYFYDFDKKKATNYLDDLLKCEENCDEKTLMKLDAEMGQRVFSPRPGYDENAALVFNNNTTLPPKVDTTSQLRVEESNSKNNDFTFQSQSKSKYDNYSLTHSKNASSM